MLKTIGILLVVLGASGAGFSMALSVQRNVTVTQQLISSLEQMKNEMLYRKTPLPELMRVLSVTSKGPAAVFFCKVADDLFLRQEASVFAIVKKNLALMSATAFSPSVRHVLMNLGSGLGKYDLEGQTRAIDLALTRLRDILEQSMLEQRGRAKSYCTLGVCAGLAIAIMML